MYEGKKSTIFWDLRNLWKASQVTINSVNIYLTSYYNFHLWGKI